MSVLAEPFIHKQLIHEWDVSPRYRPYFNTNGKIYKVTVIPQKSLLATKPVKTIIQVPVFGRTGALVIQNLGRDPVNPPDEQQDDLRPIAYYIAGTGRCEIKVSSKADPQDAKVVNLVFE